ncbi:hypothetical protein FGG08_007569, partial [Glutinoglossum americanum]
AMRGGDLKEAEKLYREALALNPRLAAAWANIGLLQSNARKYPEAVKSFSRAHAIEPNNPAYLMPLAQVQSQAGQLDGAERTLQQARRIWPLADGVLSMLATIQMNLQHYTGAADTLKDLNLIRKGKDKQTTRLLITALMGANQRKEARRYARLMALQFPTDPVAHLLVGDLAAQLQDWREAVKAYNRAFTLDPKAGKAALAAGAAAEKMGDIGQAETIYKKLAQKRSGEPIARLALGKISLLHKDYSQAQKQLEAAFVGQKNAGSEPEFLVPLGEALLFQGVQNDDRAREYLKAAVAIDPAHERARKSLAFLNIRAGRLADAVVQLRALEELNPEDLATQRQIAELLGVLGKTDAAADAWEILASKAPKDPTPLRDLAALRMKENKLPEARKALRRALTRAPDDLETQLDLAELEEKAGDIATALRVLERVTAANPAQPAPQWALACLWLRRQQPMQAEKPILALETSGAAGLNLARRRTETLPGSPEVWYVYGRLLRHAGRAEEAGKAFAESARKGFTLSLPNDK